MRKQSRRELLDRDSLDRPEHSPPSLRPPRQGWRSGDDLPYAANESDNITDGRGLLPPSVPLLDHAL